jgi:hypothetical protein
VFDFVDSRFIQIPTITVSIKFLLVEVQVYILEAECYVHYILILVLETIGTLCESVKHML